MHLQHVTTLLPPPSHAITVISVCQLDPDAITMISVCQLDPDAITMISVCHDRDCDDATSEHNCDDGCRVELRCAAYLNFFAEFYSSVLAYIILY